MVEILPNVYLTQDEYIAFLLVEFFIIYPLMGTICCIIASKKGRNATGYWFFGYFVGLIAVIVTACISKVQRTSIYKTNHLKSEPDEMELYDKLLKYKKYYEEGVLTQEEYDRKVAVVKAQINMQNQRQGQYRPVAASKPVTNKEEQLINEILKDPNSNKESKKEQLKALYNEHKITKEQLKDALLRNR